MQLESGSEHHKWCGLNQANPYSEFTEWYECKCDDPPLIEILNVLVEIRDLFVAGEKKE